MGILPACMFVHHMCDWYPQRPEEGIRSSKTWVKDGYELPRRLGIKPRSSEEQLALSTTESFLQSSGVNI